MLFAVIASSGVLLSFAVLAGIVHSKERTRPHHPDAGWDGVRSDPRRKSMNIEYLLTGLVALAIGVYLVVALLRPDKF